MIFFLVSSPDCRAPTLIVDRNHRLFILRSFRDSRMTDDWMVSWLRVVDRFATDTKTAEPKTAHRRGAFAQRLIGFNQANGNNNNASSCGFEGLSPLGN